MENLEKYVSMLNRAYHGGTTNHEQHNGNPDYWNILLDDVDSQFNGKNALDFGCGKGRNVTNLLALAKWNRVDGIDISQDNIVYCNKTYSKQPSFFFNNNGKDLSQLRDNEYDFVMSTIVFQHICVHELRFDLMKEIYRVMKPCGIFSFQMGYGDMEYKKDAVPHDYYANNYDAANTNGTFDVRVTDQNQLKADLEKIGFKDIEFFIRDSWADGGHLQWIYTKCRK